MSWNRRELLKAAAPLLGSPLILPAWAAADGGAAKPQYGGHLRTAYRLEPTGLDPHTAKSGGDWYYWRQMCDALIELDPRTGQADPDNSLARQWDVVETPPSITFTLREKVLFHDGTPFNAQAVKFNLDRVLDPASKSVARAGLAPIKSVEVLGEYRVRLNLHRPWGAALGILSASGGAMNSPAAVAKYGQDYAWHPVGTGPFQLAEVVTGSHVRMVRNEHYWRKDKAGNRLPYLDEVTLRTIKDDTVVVSALRAGELDVALLPMRDVDAFQASGDFSVGVFEGSAIAAQLVANPDLAPLDNADLRLAVMHAINPADINKAAAFGKCKVADSGQFPINHPYYKPSAAYPAYDPARAKALLKSGGKPDGFDLQVLTWPDPILAKSSEIIRAQLARVGIRVQLETLTVGAATDRMFNAKAAPLFLTSWSLQSEPDQIASINYRSGGYYNPSKRVDAALDQLIDEGAGAYDLARRKQIYQQISDQMLERGLWCPLIYTVAYWAANRKVGNAQNFVSRSDGRYRMGEVWLRQA